MMEDGVGEEDGHVTMLARLALAKMYNSCFTFDVPPLSFIVARELPCRICSVP